MPKNSQLESVKGERRVAGKKPRCLALSNEGVHTSLDFAALMSALMSDIIEERIEPRVASAVCVAGGKLLKVVEMQHKYGQVLGDGQDKVLRLSV